MATRFFIAINFLRITLIIPDQILLVPFDLDYLRVVNL